jgi:hypothetical protein
MACPKCEERREALRRAHEAWRRGDMETAKREVEFVAHSLGLPVFDWKMLLNNNREKK